MPSKMRRRRAVVANRFGNGGPSIESKASFRAILNLRQFKQQRDSNAKPWHNGATSSHPSVDVARRRGQRIFLRRDQKMYNDHRRAVSASGTPGLHPVDGPTTWAWSMAPRPTTQTGRTAPERARLLLKQSVAGRGAGIRPASLSRPSTTPNQWGRLALQQSIPKHDAEVSGRLFAQQEKSLCATRNDASVGIVRGADHAFIQMIPGSGVIAKTTGLPSIPKPGGRLQLGSVRGTSVQQRAATATASKESLSSTAKMPSDLLIHRLIQLRQAINSVHYGSKNFYQKLFQKSDVNRDELLSASEFYRFLRKHFYLNESDSKTIFDAIDLDGSGHITYDEFVDFLGVEE